MDLRQYYRKLHELESTTPESHVLVESLETGDGGKGGVISEVSRRNACQLILEGRAKRADPAGVEAFRSQEAKKREEFKRSQAAARMQLKLMSGSVDILAPTKGEE